MNKVASELGKLISFHRKERGFSQETFAEKVGIHRTYVSQLERGIKYPTILVLFQIAEALDIPLHQLIIELEKKLK